MSPMRGASQDCGLGSGSLAMSAEDDFYDVELVRMQKAYSHPFIFALYSDGSTSIIPTIKQYAEKDDTAPIFSMGLVSCLAVSHRIRAALKKRTWYHLSDEAGLR